MRALFFILISLLPVNLLFSQELHLTEKQVPAQASFAQPFSVQYQISHTPGYTVTVDEQSLSGDFSIQKQETNATTAQNTSYQFTVLPFSIGKSTFTVTFQLRQGNEVLAALAESTPIDIKPVTTFQDKKLREIRSPFKMYNWFTWLLVLLAVVALFYVLYLWTKRMTAPRSGSVAMMRDTRPCHVIALSQIEALLQSGLWEQKQYKIFYISLVDILREYLQRRFQWDVSAETSSELLARIKKEKELTPFINALRTFLTDSDLVKFAKAVPTEPQRNQHIIILRELIRQTTPPPSPIQEASK